MGLSLGFKYIYFPLNDFELQVYPPAGLVNFLPNDAKIYP